MYCIFIKLILILEVFVNYDLEDEYIIDLVLDLFSVYILLLVELNDDIFEEGFKKVLFILNV